MGQLQSQYIKTATQCPCGSGWRRPVYILSTVPTVDWVLLGSGESNKGWGFGSLHLQLVCGRASLFWQETCVIILMILMRCGATPTRSTCNAAGFVALRVVTNPAAAQVQDRHVIAARRRE
jgi:hypothetical protein